MQYSLNAECVMAKTFKYGLERNLHAVNSFRLIIIIIIIQVNYNPYSSQQSNSSLEKK
jgi:hypothetical protein